MTMTTPCVADLPGVIDIVASWQHEGLPVQVHPGDLGWYGRFGSEALAAALRVWVRDGDIVAVGLLDETGLIRMAVAPDSGDDDVLARRLADDFVGPLGDLLPAGRGVVEARYGRALRQALTDRGWATGDPWTPLRRDLSGPVPGPALRIEVVDSELVEDRVRVQAAAFAGSSFSAEGWRQLSQGHAYRTAQCLVGYDQAGAAVAAATVWSAGHGRPGLVEPLGVHGDHRGQGHGVSITLGAAEALRRQGCSSAMVATSSSNVAAVATYQAAGFVTSGEITDHCRP